MIKALHGVSTYHSNAVSDIHLAHETGYDGVEFFIDKLIRYLDNGGKARQLKQRLDHYDLKATCINALMGVDRHSGTDRQALLTEAERITQVAAELECPTVQLNPGHYTDHCTTSDRVGIITQNIGEIARIGERYGIRYQIEFVASSQFNTLPLAMQVIDTLGVDNVGVVMDFWHLHARGVSTPEDVANFDANKIFGVHFCDGRRPRDNEPWDEMVLRNYMPGEGEIDIPAYVAAIKQTGYDGAWSPELISSTLWEEDHKIVAEMCLENMSHYID